MFAKFIAPPPPVDTHEVVSSATAMLGAANSIGSRTSDSSSGSLATTTGEQRNSAKSQEVSESAMSEHSLDIGHASMDIIKSGLTSSSIHPSSTSCAQLLQLPQASPPVGGNDLPSKKELSRQTKSINPSLSTPTNFHYPGSASSLDLANPPNSAKAVDSASSQNDVPHLFDQFNFIIKPLKASDSVRSRAADLLQRLMSDASTDGKRIISNYDYDNPDMDALIFQNIEESLPASIPHPTFAFRVWSACALFIVCVEFEHCDGDNLPRDGSQELTGSEHTIKLNQITRMAGIALDCFIWHMNVLKTSNFRPEFFKVYETTWENIQLTYFYDCLLHKQWQDIWVARADLARQKFLPKRGKQELETKLQQFSWILFLLCKAKFLESFDPISAFPLLVCCTSLVIEAYSASVDQPSASNMQQQKAEKSNEDSSTREYQETIPSLTGVIPLEAQDPLKFFAAVAMASNHENGVAKMKVTREKQNGNTKKKQKLLQKKAEEARLHDSILSLIVPELSNLNEADVNKYVECVQDFVETLIVSGDLVKKSGPAPLVRRRGITRESLRSVCTARKLSSNGYNLSKIYSKLHQHSICILDETIFLQHDGSVRTTIDVQQDEGSGYDSALNDQSDSSSEISDHVESCSSSIWGESSGNLRRGKEETPHPGNALRSNRKRNYDEISSEPRMAPESCENSIPPSPNLPVAESLSFRDKVETKNWMLQILTSTPSDDAFDKFFNELPNGSALLNSIKRLLQKWVEIFIEVCINRMDKDRGGMKIATRDAELRVLHLSTSQALRLYWSVLGNIVAKIDLNSHTSSAMSLLTKAKFHRAMLACTTEVVFVANGQLSHLFPRSTMYYGVSFFQFYKAMRMFLRLMGSSVPRRLRLHLMWCDEQLTVVYAWLSKVGAASGNGPDDLFAMMRDNKSALRKKRLYSTRKYAKNPRRQLNSQLPPVLDLFLDKLEKLAAERLKQLCHVLRLDGSKGLNVKTSSHESTSISKSNDRLVSSEQNSCSLSDQELVDQIWTLLKYVIYDCWWLIRDRHLDQVIMCCVYAICKWQAREISFHSIARHYCALPSSILTGCAIGDNFDGNLDMIVSCDLGCFDPSQKDCQKDSCKDVDATNRQKINSMSTRGSLIEFYNKEFLPRTQDFLTELQNDGGRHGALISEFPHGSHKPEEQGKMKRQKVGYPNGENAKLLSESNTATKLPRLKKSLRVKALTKLMKNKDNEKNGRSGEILCEWRANEQTKNH